MAQTVGTVGGHLDLEDGVEVEDLVQRLSGDAVIEHEDPLSILTDPELDRRADHPR